MKHYGHLASPSSIISQGDRPKFASGIAQIRLLSSHSEVYEPCDDSFALVDALLADRANIIDHQPSVCLEIGCGSGCIITSLVIMLAHDCSGACYIATDINPHAVETTLDSHGVQAELICTDIASGLLKSFARLVDVVVVNPPYVPTTEDEVGREGKISSWAEWEDCESVIDRILPVVDELLSSRGWLCKVTFAANHLSQICHMMEEKGISPVLC